VSGQVAELFFGPDEPASQGHFPGNPIVPGAVLLREILRVLSDTEEPGRARIHAVKFMHAVRPGDRLTLRWQTQADGQVRFSCSTDDGRCRVLTGSLSLQAGR
jgi:3-hydroxyacyl-[acyl-carrier-protein] dehydratase